MANVLAYGDQIVAGGARDADQISYNNTNSQLQAATVQGAIDELASNASEFILGTTGVKYIAVVSALPADAASHPDTLYLIQES